MSREELDRFSTLMGELEHAYRVRLSADTIASYQRGLEDLPWEQVERAIWTAIKTSPRLPTVAVLRALVSTGRVEPGIPHGTYPPDIAARRRQLGLPVTPEEHAQYARGEWNTELPVTKAQMIRTLREVAPRANPVLRAVWLEIAGRLEREQAIGPHEIRQAGLLGPAIRAVLEREPGEEG